MINRSSYRVMWFFLPFGLFGCSLLSDKQIEINNSEIEANLIEQKTISISCGKRNIEDYIIDGWEINSREDKEAICSWKVKKSTPGCNLDRDKGCRVLIPDERGTEVKYYLERIVPIDR